MPEKWGDSTWKIVWDKSYPAKNAPIDASQLPASSWQYRYAISTFISIMLPFPFSVQLGTFTIHIGKVYKEKVLMTFAAAAMSVPPFVFWAITTYKDERTFFKWMNIEKLPDIYKDKIQNAQILEFNFKKMDVGIVVKKDSNGSITETYIGSENLFKATALRQNVAKDLLVDEEVEIVTCPGKSEYEGLKFRIIKNDGLERVWIDWKTKDRNGNDVEVDFTTLSLNTVFRIKVKHAWVVIGKYAPREGYTWYGSEKYNIAGSSYFNMEGDISGIYPVGYDIQVFGDWVSPLISVYLPQGSEFWVDERIMLGVEVGHRYAIFFRSILKKLGKIRPFLARTCQSMFFLIDSGDKVQILRTIYLKNEVENTVEEKALLSPLFSGEYSDVDFMQCSDGRWMFLIFEGGKWKVLSFQVEYVDTLNDLKWFTGFSDTSEVSFDDYINFSNWKIVEITGDEVMGQKVVMLYDDELTCYLLTKIEEKKGNLYIIRLSEKPEAKLINNDIELVDCVDYVLEGSGDILGITKDGKVYNIVTKTIVEDYGVHFEKNYSLIYIEVLGWINRQKVFVLKQETGEEVRSLCMVEFLNKSKKDGQAEYTSKSYTIDVSSDCRVATMTNWDGRMYISYYTSSGKLKIMRSDNGGYEWKEVSIIEGK